MALRRPLLTALILALCAGSAIAREGADSEPSREVEKALDDLGNPLASTREEAMRELVRLLPGSRARILEVLPKTTPAVQHALLMVLADDASDVAIKTLLDAVAVMDEGAAAQVFLRIVRDGGTAKRLLVALRKDPAHFGTGSKARKTRLDQLSRLLLRAEIEDKFISRKSPTGSTGYYRGQYDNLKYARRDALGVMLHIAQDKRMRIPGVYRTGPYRFLRPKPVDFWELRAMAVNAIGELALPTDAAELQELALYTAKLRKRVEDEHDYLRSSRRGTFRRIDPVELQERQEDFSIDVGRYGDLLTARYLILKDDTSTALVTNFVDMVEFQWRLNLRWGASTARGIKATTYIRCGWYRQAVEVYEDVLTDRWSSKATAHYNIACAYASWSLDPDLQPGEQEAMRQRALASLDNAVTEGWTDIGWMDEDGDLNPIRKTDRYKRIVRRIRVQLGLTGDD